MWARTATAATGDSVLQFGLHYYAITNLDDPSSTVLRGQAGSGGYAHDSIFLAPTTRYREWILQMQTLRVAVADFTTPISGQGFSLPEFKLQPTTSPDSDGDGLSDLAEFILGTNPNNPDTDGDGVRDGAEIQQGLDPLSGRAAATGVIASLPLPGEAKEVVLEGSILDSQQQTAYLALGSRGLGIVNASQFQEPIILGQLDLPGDATDVAVDSNLRIAAVAANAGGLHLVNVADPMQPALLQTINLNARQVEVIGGVAYVAAGGDLWSFDLASRALLQQLSLGGAPLTGLAGEGLFLYTMDSSRVLRAIDLRDGAMTPRGALTMPAGGGKLFVGNGIAYVAADDGFNGGFATADVSNPDSLALISGVDANNIAGRSVVANGSGLAIAVGRPGGGFGVPVLDVVNIADPSNTGVFLTRFNLSAPPFSLAIGSGIAFVADGSSGLQVVNYRSFDNQGIPPTITLSNSFAMTSPTNGVAEEGKLVLVSARTTDDVQVRHVEILVDGVKVFTDVSFPFEHRFIAPPLSATKSNFTVRARAIDTGGNFAWSDEITVALTPDATPPRVLRTLPAQTVVTQAVDTVIAYFSEPLDQATLNGASLYVVSAGPDSAWGTADDVALTGATLSWRDTINAAVLKFPSALPFGIYRGVITPAVTDVAGNHLTNEFRWSFAFLVNGPDGDEDGDGVSNTEELAHGTNPFASDSDGDGWSDSAEIDDGTDPNDARSKPKFTLVAQPPLQIDLPGPDRFGSAGAAIFVARPPVEICLPSPETIGTAGAPVFVARPPLQIALPSPDAFGSAGAPVYLARPPLEICLPSFEIMGTAGAPVFLARPNLGVDFQSAETFGNAGNALFVAKPPLAIDLPSPHSTNTAFGVFLALPPTSISFTNSRSGP